jgi:hypothetical protein
LPSTGLVGLVATITGGNDHLRCSAMSKPDWGFGVAALVAGVMAVAIVVLLILGLAGLF